MAGMFYSLQEAAEKLGKTPEEVSEIARAGRLREFRDGPNLLFKVDEVEALVAEEGVPIQIEGLEDESMAQAMEVEAPMDLEIPDDEVPLDLGDADFDAQPPAALEPEAPLELDIPQMETPEFEAAEPVSPDFDMPVEFETPQPQTPEPAMPEFEMPSEIEAPEMEIPELDDAISHGQPAGTSEILLAPETGAPVAPSELTNADTAITGEGLSVLGETDKDYAITDDTLGETVGSLGLAATGTTPEASLEEIEGDVNLDSFGSGSGLLDLSLQADDTSLGGILDEIYTAEDEVVEPADAGTVAEVAAEADQVAADEGLVAAQAGLAMPGFAQVFEPPLDKGGKILTGLMILPGLLLIYTFIVTLSGLTSVVPSVLTPIQGVLWYVIGALCAISLGVGIYALVADMESSPKPPKAKKVKPKKEKKPKKAKK
ncbi:MAG: hypothetical protein JW720_14525 [Sedimentisphaerales bacterium]|nr:hypothetical protein [Sedimentisphaerales bacterium]